MKIDFPLGRCLQRPAAKRQEGGLFRVHYLDVRHQTQHLKQLAIRCIQIRQHKRSLRAVDRLDHSEQYRNTDTVDQLGLLKIDYDVPNTSREKLLTLVFDALPTELIDVWTRIDHRRVLD